MKKLGTVSILNEKTFGGVRVVEFAIKDAKYHAVVTSNVMTEEDLYEALKSLGIEYINKIPLKKGVVRPSVIYREVADVKGVAVDEKPVISMDQECLVKKIKAKYETWVDGRSGFAARNKLLIKYEPEKRKIINYEFVASRDGLKKIIKDELEKVSDECCVLEKFFEIKLEGMTIYFLKKEEIEVEDFSSLQADIEKFKEECERELAEAVYKEYGQVLEGVEFGPFKDFNRIPDDYVVIWSKRTKLTADHRQNRSHTYAYWAVKKGTKGVVEVRLPEDAPIGKIIGKGGENIKELAKEVGCKIIKIKKGE